MAPSDPPGDHGPDPVQHLVDAFHTLLDEALIITIAKDYNLGDAAAWDALNGLSQSVPSEETAGSPPSCIPVFDEDSDRVKHGSAASTSISCPGSRWHLTEPSSTDASSTAAAEPRPEVPRLTYFDKESQESKMVSLQSMFAELSAYDVFHALKAADGDFQAALDDLLSKQYLKSTDQEVKGIDAFFKADDAPPQPRGKLRRRNKKQGQAASRLDGGVSRDEPLGRHEQDEADFIAERLGVRSDEVSNVYRRNQLLAGATVVELLDQYIAHGVDSQDDAVKQHAASLARKHRHVPGKYILTVVHVAGSIPQFADDLAALLNKHFSRQPRGLKVDLDYRLTPLPRKDIEGGWQVAAAAGKPGRKPATAPEDLDQVLERASRHKRAQRESLEAAAQLQRRGAANPLYRQSASFYADRAREQGRQSQRATSTAADMVVEQQTTASSVDLHGVAVHDGVRIARQKTQEWWEGLGEGKGRKAKEAGFTVITGLGRHSAGGVSPMRQVVAAALLQDGWKLQVETGKFVVGGRR